MSDNEKLPFQSFRFSLIEGRLPRREIRVSAGEKGMYELHISKGSATNPTMKIDRQIPLESACALRDALQDIGVFGWDDSYGDAVGVPMRRWTLSVVFKEGVFAVSSKGGSDVPVGFETMLDELYHLDFPRPDSDRSSAHAAKLSEAMSSFGGMPSFGEIPSLGEMPSSGEIAEMMAEMQRNPQAMQQRIKDEFAHMGPDEQNAMLDMLASTGFASRAWWERFLRGL